MYLECLSRLYRIKIFRHSSVLNCSLLIHYFVHYFLEQKKTPKVLLPLGFLNFVGTKRVLHSHTYYANTRLFKKFIEKFIEKTVQLESNWKDDFIEE